MSIWQALLLGIVQGLTEFFPVSSSAHLQLFKKIFGIHEGGSLIFFDLATHFGTLIALSLYLRKDILETLTSKKKFLNISLAIAPLVPAYFLMKPIRNWAGNELYLGLWLIATSCLLFLSCKTRSQKLSAPSSSLLIGSMQSLALIPGISRSASTIWGGKIAGLDSSEAVRFSFLLSIPTIFGGMLMEGMKAFSSSSEKLLITLPCLVGAISATLTGLFVVRFALSILEKGKFKPFAWYCLTLGIMVSLVNML